MPASRRHPETPTARAAEPPPIALVLSTRRHAGNMRAKKKPAVEAGLNPILF
jgi:hypothetical protein